jgi:hypothetical protein
MKTLFWLVVTGMTGLAGWDALLTIREDGHVLRLVYVATTVFFVGALSGTKVAIWALKGRQRLPVVEEPTP